MTFPLSYSFRRCVGALRGRTPATGYNTPTAHFRNRRCLAKMPTTLRLRISRSSPRRKPPPSRSQSAAAVPDINAPSRTVRPPFRLFDPFSAGLCRFQPTAFMAPVRTSVATEFNSGERTYSTIKPRSPSIRKPRQIRREKLPPHFINPVVSDGGEMMQQKTLRDGKNADEIHVEPFQKLGTSHIAICDVN